MTFPKQVWGLKAFCEHLLERNKFLKYMHFLEEEEGFHQAMKCINQPFNEIEMCMIILCSMPYSLSTAYWANKGSGH